MSPKLAVLPHPDKPVREAIVAALERYLERARRGEFTALAIVALDGPDTSIYTACVSRRDMLGAIEMVKDDLLHGD